MMHFIKLLLTICVCGIPLLTFGATNSFTVKTLIGSDSAPPSPPVLSSVIPVSTSQIDINWTASTDNFLLGGYQVFRDAIQIATTTLTTYSDSGLSANTSYSYSIRAFDSVFNYSTTSNTLATSTLAPAPASTTPVDEGATYGSRSGLTLQEFTIVPSQYSAKLFWKTNTFAKFDLRWGRSTSYELGFVSHDLLKREHTTEITDLHPGTVYEFELVGYDRLGKQVILKRGQFKTVSAPDTTAPANVSNLKAYVVGDTVHLSWINPRESDFSRVRIMRSHLFFPLGTQDGFLAYEDSGTSFTDRGALTTTGVQYYTVFSIDDTGNLSSGAIIAAASGNGEPPVIGTTSETDSDYTLTFEDFEFMQDEKYPTDKSLRTGESILVKIAYEKLPEHLKTITITLGSVSEAASYILKINPEKTYYEALIPAQEKDGQVGVVFSVYDFETKTMQRVSGSILLKDNPKPTNSALFTPFATTLAVQSEVVTFVLFFFILLLLIVFVMIRKKLSDR